jgi:hypothetical protein
MATRVSKKVAQEALQAQAQQEQPQEQAQMYIGIVLDAGSMMDVRRIDPSEAEFIMHHYRMTGEIEFARPDRRVREILSPYAALILTQVDAYIYTPVQQAVVMPSEGATEGAIDGTDKA